MIAILTVVAATLGGGLAGFFIPFIIAQYYNNPALSFVPIFTVPIGLIVGFGIGLYIALK